MDRPINRRIRDKSMQHLGHSPTAEDGDDRYRELVTPLFMARQPANLVRMPFSTPATLAQACRKLTKRRSERSVRSHRAMRLSLLEQKDQRNAEQTSQRHPSECIHVSQQTRLLDQRPVECAIGLIE